MKRRKYSAVAALAVAAALALAGCGSSGGSSASSSSAAAAAGKPVTLTFWSWVPNISKSVDLWNSTHKNIQVRLDEVPGGSQGTYTKMYAAVKAGTAPDLGQIEYAYLPNFVQLGDIVNIGPYVTTATKDAYSPSIWSQVSGGSAVYAIPQDFAPMGFYYRKDIFAKDGITSAPATWAQFAADAKIIHQKNPGQYILNFPTNESDWFAGLAWQAGAKWFSDDNDAWQVSISDAATAKLASYWQGLINSGDVQATEFWSDQWDKDLQDGTLAGWIAGAWGDASLATAAPKTSGDWAIAPLPQWTAGANVTGDWGGSTTAVLKGTKYPAQAAEFASWLNSNPASMNLLASDSGLYMAASTWQQTPSFATTSAFYDNEPVYSGLAKQQFPAGWLWGPTMSDTFNVLNDATGTLGSGNTLTQALSSGQNGTVSALKSAGFKLAG
jgi:multiple sugar transport system substrate-binding protein